MSKEKLLAFSPVRGFWEVECEDLDDYYEVLECETIDIVVRKIGGEAYDIICDDKGLLKDDPKISAVSPEGRVMLVGNLIFARHNDQGETISLTNDDMDQIRECCAYYIRETSTGIEPRLAVVCEFPM